MKTPAQTPFAAVFRAELLFNSKRIIPYVLVLLFSANAVLWWASGPAVSRGWATNSDFYIVRLFGGFTFMTLPLFVALMMGDPVIRDFRTGIDPLIFSKPIGRASYLMGKFFGNFFVLIGCQAFFALTLFLLQAVGTSGMVVLPARVTPYLKHFLLFVVFSSLLMSAVCFTVGTLTRNVKIVYGLVTGMYFVYIAWQIAIKDMSVRWRIVLDPLLFNWGSELHKGQNVEWLNHIPLDYDPALLANRAVIVLLAAAFLGVLHFRFRMGEGTRRPVAATGMDFSGSVERLVTETERPAVEVPVRIEKQPATGLPKVTARTEGFRATCDQFLAALVVELNLLFSERSLIFILPLAILLCFAGIAYFKVIPEGSYAAAYAGRAAESLLPFLCAITVFYTGEAMHRDRELRFEPVLWSLPVPNSVLLSSKFAATLMLSVSLVVLVEMAACGVQFFRGNGPVGVLDHLTIQVVISLPNIVFLIAVVTFLNVVLRDKYLAYAACFALGGGLFYLYTQGYNHWSYNPLLYRLWTPARIVGEIGDPMRFVLYRGYTLSLAALFMWIAHVLHERGTTFRARRF